jgi:hypothetical protein
VVKYTNEHNIDLPLAIWLLQDGYKSGADIAPPGELISVTTLLKPTRQLILQRKVDRTKETVDLSELIASRRGHAFHDSIERSWTEGDWQGGMRKLHYPQKIIDRVKINPDPDKLGKEDIPIYLERREFRPFEDVVITGQLDFLIGSAYRDFKSTSTFAWTSGNKDEDYILQGSMYRWVMPHLIKDDVMRIEFIFSDWLRYRAKQDRNYPQAPVGHKEYKMLSLGETESWISGKLDNIRANAGKSQDKMVLCTDKELWRSEDTFKYYSNPETAKAGGRCTRRFDKEADAELHRADKGKGVVVRDKGEVKACLYCPAFSVCEQRTDYFKDDGTPA